MRNTVGACFVCATRGATRFHPFAKGGQGGRNTGIDPLRGRPTPGLASTEEKIQRRKFDSLKRGIHRINDEAGMPYTIHLVGIGGAGTAVVARAMEQISARRSSQSAPG